MENRYEIGWWKLRPPLNCRGAWAWWFDRAVVFVFRCCGIDREWIPMADCSLPLVRARFSAGFLRVFNAFSACKKRPFGDGRCRFVLGDRTLSRDG